MRAAEILSQTVVPFVLIVLCVCFIKDGSLFDSFVKGAKNGLKTTVNILPTMTLLLVALTVFNASGTADGISDMISPLCDKIGIPAGIIPLAITKPFSGSASTASYASVLDTFGPDSFESFAASVLMGSGDTLVYVISVYYSATRVRKTKYVFKTAVFVYIFGLFFACIISRLFFA